MIELGNLSAEDAIIIELENLSAKDAKYAKDARCFWIVGFDGSRYAITTCIF